MKAYKTGSGPKILFRINLNNRFSKSKIDHEIGQKVPSAVHRKKADSPGQNFLEIRKVLAGNLGLVLAGVSLAILGTFIFVWYTALKRNL